MRDRGHYFAATPGGQVSKNQIDDGSANVGERVAVEKQKRGPAMALPQEFYAFGEGLDGGLFFAPLSFNRCVAL